MRAQLLGFSVLGFRVLGVTCVRISGPFNFGVPRASMFERSFLVLGCRGLNYKFEWGLGGHMIY